MTSGDFAGIRTEFGLPKLSDTALFSQQVLGEAAVIAVQKQEAPVDRSDLPFVTIDPPDAKDLDQAVYLERTGNGFRLHYAIADLSVIVPGGYLDSEARRRVHTVYLPDAKVPLHPVQLSEGACSLLPKQVRRAAVWTIDVAADGTPGEVRLERALVKSVAKLDYEGVAADMDKGTVHPSIEPLADFGAARLAWRMARGALELNIPEQEVVPDGDGWKLQWRRRNRADAANAELSLLTGMAAADLMITGGVGILRTLPEPSQPDLANVRRQARLLKIDWPEGKTAGQLLLDLPTDDPHAMAFRDQATRLLRGANYVAFTDGAPKEQTHAGIGGAYAHVTAPLRRLGDRFATEVCLALAAGEKPPAWAVEALPALPELLTESDKRASQIDRAVVDLVECWELAGREGERFDAIVLDIDERGAEIVIDDLPYVVRTQKPGLSDGATVSVTLTSVDVDKRVATFA